MAGRPGSCRPSSTSRARPSARRIRPPRPCAPRSRTAARTSTSCRPPAWWLVSRDASSAEYIAPRPVVGDDPPFAHASVEVKDGAWRIAGWGDCRPEIVLDGRNVATWVAGSTPCRRQDRPRPTITAFVTERTCTGGQPMGARLQPPRITRTDDSVLVVFAAVPLEGDAFDCQGNPSTRVTFDLGEPLGDRRLLDGAFFPAVEPVAPA